MRLTLRQLRHLVAIVEAESMTRAAESLRVGPNALSQQVKAMEDALGVDLLERHVRGVRPTPPGHELYERVSTAA